MDYASYGEAPKRFYFWTAIATLAGAVRRKIWIDQSYFQWHANFYICLVAPPGIVSKTTTASVGMSLLREVPGIKFGPDVVTWPSLVTDFADKTESFEFEGSEWPMSPMTLESGEFGNLLDPQDKQMVDLLVTLWDGKQGSFRKTTKFSGSDEVPNPWINIIACTTPSWIAGNFPEYMIGGGLTSRMIFCYAEQKEKLVAYPGLVVPPGQADKRRRLIEDLTHISEKLVGPMRLTDSAITWGEAWYRRHYTQRPTNLDPERFGGYLARKQTHIHKTAMILSIAERDDLVITDQHLMDAEAMLTELEPDMQFVFSKIGRSTESLGAEKLIKFVHGQGKDGVLFDELFRYVHSVFPSQREFEDVFAGCVKSGFVRFLGGRVFPGVNLPQSTSPDVPRKVYGQAA